MCPPRFGHDIEVANLTPAEITASFLLSVYLRDNLAPPFYDLRLSMELELDR